MHPSEGREISSVDAFFATFRTKIVAPRCDFLILLRNPTADLTEIPEGSIERLSLNYAPYTTRAYL